MSKKSGGPTRNNGGTDFNLPDEILTVMPMDPYDQLDLARKITSMAIASKVKELEAEVDQMRVKVAEKDRTIYELDEKISSLEEANQEVDSRLKMVLHDNLNLGKERESLAMEMKILRRDYAKLDMFKKQLMQSIDYDNQIPPENVNMDFSNQPVPKAYPDEDDETNSYYSVHTSYNNSTNIGKTIDEVSGSQRYRTPPYISPRLTPNQTPKFISARGSPRRYSATASPDRNSGITSPIKSLYERRGSVSSSYPSSHQGSPLNSPPHPHLPSARTRTDGKEFFRQAKTLLSLDQFSAFLDNVKLLNAKKQTREETLKKADEIFGEDNKDLYASFQGLLNYKVK